MKNSAANKLKQVPRIMMETGGSRHHVSPEGWLALVPIWKVAWYKLSQN